VYVVPFDGARVLSAGSEAAGAGGGKWEVSSAGGRFPRWRKDGKEIFYLSPSNQIMAAEIDGKGNGIEVRTPQALFRSGVDTAPFAPFDVTADGKKFVINNRGEQNMPLTLVVNWTARLKKQ
jgi:hypothetical protein